ncbi:hypothetical protein T552_00768 [Pneumocystis carinii B80]|uniref:Diphthine--ammonia ligase n=1 Tax=Pneumocystis carinii (strain B80) TaxID=1408658 RepID=A0A0W4ZPI6_PNEC8|nr:hypothetical protein T552_00768 [Pneumocystis carinii B80]KTW30293.1 hypothetical protein T552_00768 [Pneumocystis carinii B80]
MYQTVGQDVVELFEKAMNVPLYREIIIGTSVDQSFTYHETLDDEAEDLYRLLKRIQKIHPDIEAISVGAILSNYQRTRVENVCKRLNLISLAYLWKRDQKDLLEEMISQNLHAIIIKVSTLGLDRSHLGKSLIEIKEHLLKINELYDVHLCGEGGEYETLVLDCPIFQKKIKIVKSEIVDHSPGVSYLKFKAEIEEKSFVDTNWKKRFILPDQLDKKCKQFKKYLDEFQDEDYNKTSIIPTISIKNKNDEIFMNSSKLKNLIAIGGINLQLESENLLAYTLEEEFHFCMSKLKDYLKSYILDLCDIVFFELVLEKMDYILHVDALYSQYFSFSKPPPRICINSSNLKSCRLQISVLVDPSRSKRSVVHIQSQNYWLPANKGFCSHALIHEDIVFIAGQIGAIPSTLSLPYPKSFSSEVAISLQNLEKIFESLEIFNISCIAFISNESHVSLTNKAWKYCSLYNEDCLIILVNGLSYGALIEWHLIGKKKQKIAKNNSWSILHLTLKNHENFKSLETMFEVLLKPFKEKNSNNKILSSTIYYNSKIFEETESSETVSKIILNIIHIILGYTIEAHCISTNGIWIGKETVIPVLIAMKIIYSPL